MTTAGTAVALPCNARVDTGILTEIATPDTMLLGYVLFLGVVVVGFTH